MGNQPTKEAREAPSSNAGRPSPNSSTSDPQQQRSRNRFSRADMFGLGHAPQPPSSSRNDTEITGVDRHERRDAEAEDEPFRHRETRQEREARRREREKVIREKEREKSVKEEGVDGGYLVTLGTYPGPEDFSKPVVRQLQIERKLAPFWRGLNDHLESWTDYQLISAVRGLPIPDDDATPPPDFTKASPAPQPTSAPPQGSRDLHGLSAPPGSRGLSSPSERGTAPNPTPPPCATDAAALRTSSPFKPRGARALAAALSFASRNASETEIVVARESVLPADPNVDGKPIEVVLYREAHECPICFLYYPPYLNYTRCCAQPICSECFVQIKRADPHLPGHRSEERGAPDSVEGQIEQLVSEPATCPYCQRTELGVTYDPPPFRRGHVYATVHDAAPPSLAPPADAAATSQSSLHSAPGPASPVPATMRRRTQSLSADAPNVVTTDRVRPDWVAKLLAAQQHRARRAAAATALHAAAFMPAHQRSLGNRFGLFRRTTSQAGPSSDGGGGGGGGGDDEHGRRQNPLESLEQLMFEEAIRLSLAAQEEEARREAKMKEKETKKKEKEERRAAEKQERKALKQQQRDGLYGSAGASAGASLSSLSLPFGRRRGNSTSNNNNLLPESAQATASSQPGEPEGVHGKGKAVERAPSHLRHASNASDQPPAPRRGEEGADARAVRAGGGAGVEQAGAEQATDPSTPTDRAPESGRGRDVDELVGLSGVVERSKETTK